MDQPDHDGDHLLVPTASQSQHSAATSSAPEVEDCDDLEVAGIDSETNIVGVAWTGNAKEQDRISDGGSFTQVEELQEIPGREGRLGSIDDDDDETDGGDDGDERPQDRPTLRQSQTDGEGFKRNHDRFDSSDEDDDDDDDASKPQGTTNQPTAVAFHQSSTETGEQREMRHQYERSQSRTTTAAADDDDDFDDSEDDDDGPTGVAVKPTFCPFIALSAAAGGDHESVDNDAKSIPEYKDVISQDKDPVAAAVATAVSKESVHKEQSFYGVSSEDDDDDAVNDVDGDNKVGDVREKNSAGVPSTGAADSFDNVFAKNFDALPQTVDENGSGVQIATSGNNTGRSFLNPDDDEVEDLEEKVTKGQNLPEDQRSRIRKWTSSVTRALGPSHDDDDDDEDVEMFGDKAGTGDNNELNMITSMAETKSAGKEAVNEVRIRLFRVV